MASLTQIDLLQKAELYELLKDTTPYLLHPNLWIRQATAGNFQLSAGHGCVDQAYFAQRLFAAQLFSFSY